MGMGFNDFTFPNHIPPFLDEVVANAPDDIKTMCSDNPQCIFDAVQTNNPEIGVGTLDSIEHNNNDIMVASKTFMQCMCYVWHIKHKSSILL